MGDVREDRQAVRSAGRWRSTDGGRLGWSARRGGRRGAANHGRVLWRSAAVAAGEPGQARCARQTAGVARAELAVSRPSAAECLETRLEALDDLPADFARRVEEVLKKDDVDRSQAIRQLFEDVAGE